MKVHPRHVPGFEEIPVRVHVVGAGSPPPGVVLSVDEGAVSRGPLVRGAGPPFLGVGPGGERRRFTRQAEQRKGFLPVDGGDDSHLDRFRRRHPEREPVAVTGCGNLGMNPGVVARLPQATLGHEGPCGGWMSVEEDGGAMMVERGTVPVKGFIISGPRLVRGGRPAELQVRAFADPRHLLLFPYVDLGDGLRVDFGHDRFLGDPALCRRAVEGRPVRLELLEHLPAGEAPHAALRPVPVPRERLEEALAAKGYRAVARPEEPGTYRLDGDAVVMTWLPGIYPHHVLARRDDGRVLSVLVTGAGSRAGVHVRELCGDLAAAGITDALLMDNGGDVGLYLPRTRSYAARPVEPDRSACWPLSACFIWFQEAGVSGSGPRAHP